MDWNQIVTSVILGVVGIILSALGGLVSYFITTKIKDEKIKKILSDGFNVVNNGVQYVYQTYVQNLKGTDLWDKEAMKIANQKAVDYITKNLSSDVSNYLSQNGKDIQEWISEQIEIAIAKDKKTSS